MTTQLPSSPADIPAIKRHLKQLQELHAAGALTSQSYDESRVSLERRLLDLVLSDAPPAETSTQSDVSPKGTSSKMLAFLGIGVLAIAAAGYIFIGRSNVTSLAETQSAPGLGAEGTQAGKPHSTNFDQIAEMTDKLATRLKENPQDSEGWAMLARSYTVLSRNADALDAFAKAYALRGNDAVLLADYADALALKNDKKLGGEPMKMVERALKLDPQNLKALSLAGTHAFEMKDYAGAIRHWEKMVLVGPAGNNLIEQIMPGLAQARELAGLPPGKPVVPIIAAAVGEAPRSRSVSGTVTLQAKLASQVQPDYTLFVFARPADGSRMPLAILQRKVRDLPLQFTLDDSLAMSPESAISKASKVTVVARISKTGNAMPDKGDLSGQSGPVAVGSTGVAIEINDLVKQ